MTPVIVEREFSIHTDGAPDKGFVRLHAPEPRNGSWWCDVDVDFASMSRPLSIAGVDAYQSLLLAMRVVPTLVSISTPFIEKRLYVAGDAAPLTDLEPLFGFAPSEGTP